MNIKQKVKVKIQQINIDILSNQILMELLDCMFQFIQIKITIQKKYKAKRNYLRKGIIKKKIMSNLLILT